MKKLLFLLSLIAVTACFTSVATTTVTAQAWSIKIDPAQDKDSVYFMLSDTVYSKYRYGKFKSYNLVQKRNLLTGYKEYTALMTQSSTSAPTATVLVNTLGGTLVWTYTGVGVYTGTLSGAFPAAKTTGNSAYIDVVASGDNTYSLYRGTDNTILLKTYSDVGTTAANAMITALPITIRVYN